MPAIRFKHPANRLMLCVGERSQHGVSRSLHPIFRSDGSCKSKSWRLALAFTPRALVPLRRARGSSFERAQLIFERVRAWHCRARIVSYSRREIAVITCGVDFIDETGDGHPALFRDLFQASPESFLNTDARLVPCNRDGALDDCCLHGCPFSIFDDRHQRQSRIGIIIMDRGCRHARTRCSYIGTATFRPYSYASFYLSQPGAR